MNKQTKIRKPFLCAFMFALIGGGFFYYAYFSKTYFFKQEKVFVKGPSTIKIDIFSDLHATSGAQSLDNKSITFLDKFIDYTNQSKPNAVVINGDVIEGTKRSAEKGIFELGLVRQYLEKIATEKIWIIGNHDLRSVNHEQWKSSLGIDYLDKSFEIGDYKIIVLDDNYEMGKNEKVGPMNGGVLLSDEQFVWLEKELENSDKIKIVFMHNPPLFGNDMEKNSYSPKGIEKIQKLFSKYCVSAVFSGHVERLVYKNIGGVEYYVFPGPVKCPEYPGAFESIRMLDKKVVVTVFSENEKKERIIQKIQ